jgi:uncharacterized protein YjbJ (UPF0337 family)
MTNDINKGKWAQVRSKIHARWGRLTEDDIDKINGKHDQFIGMLQDRYGCTKQKAEDQLRRYTKAVTARPWLSFFHDHGWGAGPSQRHNKQT